jgi:hypothetical protein
MQNEPIRRGHVRRGELATGVHHLGEKLDIAGQVNERAPRKAPYPNAAGPLRRLAVAAWGGLSEADRRDKLAAIAAALRSLPLAERAQLAAKLLWTTLRPGRRDLAGGGLWI